MAQAKGERIRGTWIPTTSLITQLTPVSSFNNSVRLRLDSDNCCENDRFCNSMPLPSIPGRTRCRSSSFTDEVPRGGAGVRSQILSRVDRGLFDSRRIPTSQNQGCRSLLRPFPSFADRTSPRIESFCTVALNGLLEVDHPGFAAAIQSFQRPGLPRARV
jgi:hypothetical protein